MPSHVQLPVPVARRLEDGANPWQAASDYDTLRRIALGMEPSDVRQRAVVALAETDNPGRVGDLAWIATTSAMSPRLRHLAVTLLGRIDSDSARQALLHALDPTDPALAGAIALSLGRIGDRAAHDALAAAAKKLTGLPLKRARFGQLLIAHRLGLDLPEPADDAKTLEPPAADGRAFDVTPANAIEAQVAARSMAGASYGVDLVAELAHQIRCDDTRSMLLLDGHLADDAGMDRLLRRRCVAAAIGRRIEASGLYVTSLLVLTTPLEAKGSIAIGVHQPDATRVFQGSGRVHENTLTLELRSVARRGAFAVQIEGRLREGRVTLDTARVGLTRLHAGQPGRDRSPRR